LVIWSKYITLNQLLKIVSLSLIIFISQFIFIFIKIKWRWFINWNY